MDEYESKSRSARAAMSELALLSAAEKQLLLREIRLELESSETEILAANQLDLELAQSAGMSAPLQDRLRLTPSRLADLAAGIDQVADLPDPVGEVIRSWERPNGLKISKVRVPIGVIGIIYEARPNVTVDAAVLCLKTGNSVVLRGSSSALNSNRALVQALQRGLIRAKRDPNSVQLIEDPDRSGVERLGRLSGLIDVLIPRGGAALIRRVIETATVPVIETGAGNCHVYVDRAAAFDMACSLVINAKTQRPSVCNAVESLLIDVDWPTENTRKLLSALAAAGVEIRGCAATREIYPAALPAVDADWAEEYLDLIIAVRMVTGVGEAVDHINHYGSRNSELIVTENQDTARYFLVRVDAAAVYHNASTRFTDGGEFGFGAEIGVSTQKLHARGPMGLPELTSYKYILEGSGQVR